MVLKINCEIATAADSDMKMIGCLSMTGKTRKLKYSMIALQLHSLMAKNNSNNGGKQVLKGNWLQNPGVCGVNG